MKYWNYIKSKIWNPLFISAFVGLIVFWQSGDIDGLIGAIVGYVGIKSIMNTLTPTTEDDKTFTPAEHFLLSFRTWFAILGVVICYFARRPEDLKLILLEFSAGWGIDWISVQLKAVDWSKFVARPPVIVNQPQMPNTTSTTTSTNTTVSEPVALPAAISAEANGPATKPEPTPYALAMPNLETFEQDTKDEVDQDLADRIGLGQIVGVSAQSVTKEQAKKMLPILSSDNPSMVWARMELRSLSILIDDIQQSIDFHEKFLIPWAKKAVTDQLGSILASGNKCTWNPSPFAAYWLEWGLDHVSAMKEIQRTKFYDFKDYSIWFTGEISDGWVNHKVPWLTTFTAGIQKDYIYPDKP